MNDTSIYTILGEDDHGPFTVYQVVPAIMRSDAWREAEKLQRAGLFTQIQRNPKAPPDWLAVGYFEREVIDGSAIT